MTDTPKTTLVLNFPVSTSPEETLARIEKIAKSPQQIGEPSTKALLYLRAASGRASLALSAFYFFLAAEASTEKDRIGWTYAQLVKHSTLRFSSISTVALCVRAIFDHSGKDTLCAKLITGASKTDFAKVATYWSKRNSRNVADAEAALHFVLGGHPNSPSCGHLLKFEGKSWRLKEAAARLAKRA